MRGENKQRGQERGENSGGREGTASSGGLEATVCLIVIMDKKGMWTRLYTVA